jgi:hypothetical protein
VKAKVRKGLSGQAAQKFDVERFNLKKFNALEVRKEYQIKMPRHVCSFGDLNDSNDINRAWENIKGNIKISAIEGLGVCEQ